MKLVSALAKDISDGMCEKENKLIHLISSSKGYITVDPPKWANEVTCPFCGETSYFLFMIDDVKRSWNCGRVCMGSKLPNYIDQGVHTKPEKRCVEWPLFCEINGIGDEHYEVKFEHIQQSKPKLDYMLKFALAPRGLIFMHGPGGTGKTYASMGMCELFTRKNSYCVFSTQKQMANKWLLAMNDPLSNFANSIMSANLLVVDDFATGDPNPKFLEFFMEVINTRMQWKSRGTVITTNVDVKKFNEYCGQALVDRIMIGQSFKFEGKSRRKKLEL